VPIILGGLAIIRALEEISAGLTRSIGDALFDDLHDAP
jgi:hypothetical protein